jgi:hypothetical protein
MTLTNEQARILRAARDGRLRIKDTYRWIIDGESAPDFKTRRRLWSRGWLEHPVIHDAERPWLRWDSSRLVPSKAGLAALKAHEALMPNISPGESRGDKPRNPNRDEPITEDTQ